MHTETKKKKIRMMCALWGVVPAVFCIYVFAVGSPNDGAAALFIAVMFISGIFMAWGAFIYLGHIGLLAGFNTMAPEELEKYDTEKVSAFMGMSLMVAAFALLFSSAVILLTINDVATIAVSFLIIALMVLFSAFYVFGERFKA